jgi:alcohol dehydrogenase class IV
MPLALYAISLIADNLVNVYTGRDESKEAWEKLTVASTIGGMVINTAGVTLAHGMEHPASGLKNIVHGQGLAALTPAVIEKSYKGCREKYSKISRLLGGLTAERLCPAGQDASEENQSDAVPVGSGTEQRRHSVDGRQLHESIRCRHCEQSGCLQPG